MLTLTRSQDTGNAYNAGDYAESVRTFLKAWSCNGFYTMAAKTRARQFKEAFDALL